MLASDLMTPDPVTLGHNDPLISAEEIMGLRGFRHMPVVDNDGKLVGLLSQLDIVRKTLEGDEGDRRAQMAKKAGTAVRDIMSSKLDTVNPGTDIKEVARLMRRTRHSCLPVVDADRKLVGILTEADFVVLVAELVAHSEKADRGFFLALRDKVAELKKDRG